MDDWNSKPKFRPEVEVVRISPDTYVVKDPESEALKYFQCKRLQVEIIRRLDGRSSVEAVAAEVSSLFGTRIPTERVAAFILSLDKQLLLEPESSRPLEEEFGRKAARRALRRLRRRRIPGFGPAPDNTPASDAAGRAALELNHGDPISASRHLAEALRREPANAGIAEARNIIKRSILEQAPRSEGHWPMIRVFNPYRLLVAMHRWFAFVFTREFLIALGVGCLISLAITIARWKEIWTALFTWEAWTGARFAVALTIAFLMLVLHELGHGVACVHYGGRPRKIGVMLLLFVLPAAYCDVTDSVLFTTRASRVVTFVAGVVATTIVWCVVTPLWLLTPPGTLLNDGLLITSAITGLSNIGQFMPLYKFDGHFILASIAGHQALFEESWQHVRGTVIRPWIERAERSFWGPTVALGAANGLLCLLVAVYCGGYGAFVSYGITAVLGFGIASLFFQALRGPVQGERYNRLKRDFAAYALIFLVTWLIAAAEFLWTRLVPALRGYGALIVIYLVWRSLRRNTRMILGANGEVRPGRPRAWAAAAAGWLTVDALAAEWTLAGAAHASLAQMAAGALHSVVSARFWWLS